MIPPEPAPERPREDPVELEALRADHNSYPKPAVTTDLVVMTVLDADLRILLIQRANAPQRGSWALPGGFVDVGPTPDEQGEDLDTAAHRELAEETGLPVGTAFLEQLYTFGAADRDPRGRIITVAYYALLSPTHAKSIQAGSDAADARWFSVQRDLPAMPLAFDHDQIITTALTRIRGKIDYAPIAFELVPETFTIAELRTVHEAVKGQSYDPGNFRRRFKRMLTDGVLEPTDQKRKTGTKPALLYRFARRP